MVAFHARLDYLSQNLLKEVFVRRAYLFAISLNEIGRLDLKDRAQVRESNAMVCTFDQLLFTLQTASAAMN